MQRQPVEDAETHGIVLRLYCCEWDITRTPFSFDDAYTRQLPGP